MVRLGARARPPRQATASGGRLAARARRRARVRGCFGRAARSGHHAGAGLCFMHRGNAYTFEALDNLSVDSLDIGFYDGHDTPNKQVFHSAPRFEEKHIGNTQLAIRKSYRSI